MQIQGLGTVTSAAAGIVVSGSTNASPVVLTVNAGHGKKIGDWVNVNGITGNTGANGERRLSAVSATTLTLEGSVGNGTHGGTPVFSSIMYQTPFLPKREVVASISDGSTTLVGTVLVESSDDGITFADAKKGVALAANPGSVQIEVDLKKFMRFRCSAFTSGGARCELINAY